MYKKTAVYTNVITAT